MVAEGLAVRAMESFALEDDVKAKSMSAFVFAVACKQVVHWILAAVELPLADQVVAVEGFALKVGSGWRGCLRSKKLTYFVSAVVVNQRVALTVDILPVAATEGSVDKY